MNANSESNILLVANYKSDVGFAWWIVENFWSEIARHFKRSNKRCFLIYPEINTVPDVVKNAPIEILQHDFSDRRLAAVMNLLKIVRSNNIKYVYLTDQYYCHWIYLVLRLAGVKRIIDHDHMPGERSKVPLYKKVGKRLVHKFNLLSCDLYIGVSKFVKERAVEIACVPEEKCVFVHNGIKVFDNRKTFYAHDEFNIPRDASIVVTTGRAVFYKGIDSLISCARVLIVERGLTNIYFLHVGDGPDLQEFKKIATNLGVADKFIFAGLRSDVPKILPSCDIGIQVSLGEAFSLSIIEYLCAGLATLVPDNCGNSEAIENGVNGILFKPSDINGIVESISMVLSNTELADKMRSAARKSVEERFSLQRCNENLLFVLDKQFT